MKKTLLFAAALMVATNVFAQQSGSVGQSAADSRASLENISQGLNQISIATVGLSKTSAANLSAALKTSAENISAAATQSGQSVSKAVGSAAAAISGTVKKIADGVVTIVTSSGEMSIKFSKEAFEDAKKVLKEGERIVVQVTTEIGHDISASASASGEVSRKALVGIRDGVSTSLNASGEASREVSKAVRISFTRALEEMEQLVK